MLEEKVKITNYMTCKDCEREKSCVYATIDPKELCYKFRKKESEVDTE